MKTISILARCEIPLPLLAEVEVSANERLEYSERLSTGVLDSAKSFILHNEETRKKQLVFLNQLHFEKLSLERESTISRQAYLESCNTVKCAQDKLDKTPSEKQNKILHQLILDMKNSKNTYLLSIESANRGKAKYFEYEIPKFLLGKFHRP
jgi:hypothetical protein